MLNIRDPFFVGGWGWLLDLDFNKNFMADWQQIHKKIKLIDLFYFEIKY